MTLSNVQQHRTSLLPHCHECVVRLVCLYFIVMIPIAATASVLLSCTSSISVISTSSGSFSLSDCATTAINATHPMLSVNGTISTTVTILNTTLSTLVLNANTDLTLLVTNCTFVSTGGKPSLQWYGIESGLSLSMASTAFTVSGGGSWIYANNVLQASTARSPSVQFSSCIVSIDQSLTAVLFRAVNAASITFSGVTVAHSCSAGSTVAMYSMNVVSAIGTSLSINNCTWGNTVVFNGVSGSPSTYFFYASSWYGGAFNIGSNSNITVMSAAANSSQFFYPTMFYGSWYSGAQIAITNSVIVSAVKHAYVFSSSANVYYTLIGGSLDASSFSFTAMEHKTAFIVDGSSGYSYIYQTMVGISLSSGSTLDVSSSQWSTSTVNGKPLSLSATFSLLSATAAGSNISLCMSNNVFYQQLPSTDRYTVFGGSVQASSTNVTFTLINNTINSSSLASLQFINTAVPSAMPMTASYNVIKSNGALFPSSSPVCSSSIVGAFNVCGNTVVAGASTTGIGITFLGNSASMSINSIVQYNYILLTSPINYASISILSGTDLYGGQFKHNCINTTGVAYLTYYPLAPEVESNSRNIVSGNIINAFSTSSTFATPSSVPVLVGSCSVGSTMCNNTFNAFGASSLVFAVFGSASSTTTVYDGSFINISRNDASVYGLQSLTYYVTNNVVNVANASSTFIHNNALYASSIGTFTHTLVSVSVGGLSFLSLSKNAVVVEVTADDSLVRQREFFLPKSGVCDSNVCNNTAAVINVTQSVMIFVVGYASTLSGFANVSLLVINNSYTVNTLGSVAVTTIGTLIMDPGAVSSTSAASQWVIQQNSVVVCGASSLKWVVASSVSVSTVNATVSLNALMAYAFSAGQDIPPVVITAACSSSANMNGNNTLVICGNSVIANSSNVSSCTTTLCSSCTALRSARLSIVNNAFNFSGMPSVSTHFCQDCEATTLAAIAVQSNDVLVTRASNVFHFMFGITSTSQLTKYVVNNFAYGFAESATITSRPSAASCPSVLQSAMTVVCNNSIVSSWVTSSMQFTVCETSSATRLLGFT